jgi:outer membrane protein assembly factor BamB
VRRRPRTRAPLRGRLERRHGVRERGLAVGEHLYAAGTDLHAVDPGTGEHVWSRETGDWRWTAPALRFEVSFRGRVGPGPVLDDGVVYVVAQTGASSFHLLALAGAE